MDHLTIDQKYDKVLCEFRTTATLGIGYIRKYGSKDSTNRWIQWHNRMACTGLYSTIVDGERYTSSAWVVFVSFTVTIRRNPRIPTWFVSDFRVLRGISTGNGLISIYKYLVEGRHQGTRSFLCPMPKIVSARVVLGFASLGNTCKGDTWDPPYQKEEEGWFIICNVQDPKIIFHH